MDYGLLVVWKFQSLFGDLDCAVMKWFNALFFYDL